MTHEPTGKRVAGPSGIEDLFQRKRRHVKRSAGLDQYGSESDLTRTRSEELQPIYLDEKGKPWEFQIVRDLSQVKRDSKASTSEGIEPQRLYLGTAIARWLLLVALGLMAIEVVLAWYFGHYSAVHERDAPHRAGRAAGMPSIFRSA